MTTSAPTYTSFDGHRRIAGGTLLANALAVRHALARGGAGQVLLFDDASGRTVDIDTRGTEDELRARFTAPAEPAADVASPDEAAPRGRGRPRLGVVPREVTLLPRHWDWLAGQPGGASVALRKLVEDARRAGAAADRQRQAQERAYHFMLAIAGDLPGYEDATRALFAGDLQRLVALIAAWPADVREHALRLASGDEAAA